MVRLAGGEARKKGGVIDPRVGGVSRVWRRDHDKCQPRGRYLQDVPTGRLSTSHACWMDVDFQADEHE